MKKIILLIIATISIYAGIIEVETLYNNNEFEKAIEEARASKDEYSNPRLHLLWAKSAEALGRDDEAMSAYERVIMLDDENVDARVALAKVYDKTKRHDLANETKIELQNYQLTPEQRNSLGLLKGEDIEEVKAQAKLSVGYDSNINVSANKADKISTFFGRFSGSASYINELGDKNGLYARADFKLYYQNNTSAHYYDMLLAGLDLGLGYSGDGYSVHVPLGYDRIHYLDVDMLGQFRLEPKVNITFDNIIINANLKYSKRSYKQDIHKGMNDTSYGIGSGLYYLLGKNFAYINLKYETFSSDETLHSLYIDRDTVTASIGLNYNISDSIVSRIDYRYRLSSYDDLATLTEKREDDYNQFELKLSYYLDEKLELYISDRYIKNNSNYTQSDYSKNIAMFGLSVNY